MKHRSPLFLIAIPALALVAVACGRSSEDPAGSTVSNSVRAQVLTVAQNTGEAGYTVTGSVKAQFNATLSSKVTGKVVSVSVREGDSIRKGQALISLDARELDAAVNMAGAGYHSSLVGVASAKTAAAMEQKTSVARIAQAEAQVRQAEAAIASAEARRDLALAGPRPQEVAQTHIAVVQAESNVKVAKLQLDRATILVQEGALARRELELAQNRYDLAKGQYDSAIQAEKIAQEGTRTEEIRAAQEGVRLANAALKEARAGVLQAKAAAMQVDVRQRDIEVANAQVQQASAAVQSAQVSRSYAVVTAPFAGRVVQRLADPGSMAAMGVPLLGVEGGEFRLEAIVPENLVKTLSVGTTAPIEIGGKKLNGKVVEIVPQGDAFSHSFVVKFALPPSSHIKSGMFGKARIPAGSVRRVLIPAAATWEREGLTYVFVVNAEGIARLRIVTLGEVFEGQVEVLSGLNPGEKIVVGNRDEVADGSRVEAIS